MLLWFGSTMSNIRCQPLIHRDYNNLLFSLLCCFLVRQDLLSTLVYVQKYIKLEDLRLGSSVQFQAT